LRLKLFRSLDSQGWTVHAFPAHEVGVPLKPSLITTETGTKYNPKISPENKNKMNEKAGSCLCKKINFEIEGEFDSFYLCHCGRCRKDTGSAHAANFFLTLQN